MIGKIKDNLAVLVLGLATLLGMYAYFSWAAIRENRVAAFYAEKSKTWPKVIGKVTGGEIEVERKSRRDTKYYFALPKYRYMVKGKVFYNTRICFTPNNCYFGSDEKTAVSLLQEYPKGSKVTVYYEANDPQNSVLRPGGSELIQESTAELQITLWRTLPFAPVLLVLGLWIGSKFGYGYDRFGKKI